MDIIVDLVKAVGFKTLFTKKIFFGEEDMYFM